MNSRSRSILIAVMVGVVAGVAGAYAAAYSLVEHSLRQSELDRTQGQHLAWAKASSLNTLVSYRAFVARFPDKISQSMADKAIRILVKNRSPQFQSVSRVRLVVRQNFGEAKMTLPLREMVKEWFSFVGISVVEDSDPRFDAVVTVLINARALSAVYTFHRTELKFPFSLYENSGEQMTRYTGAFVQGKVIFAGANDVWSEKAYLYRIDPPQHITEMEREGEPTPGWEPLNAPFLEAAKSSLGPAMARLMADHFGAAVLDKGATSGNLLVQAGAEAVKVKGKK